MRYLKALKTPLLITLVMLVLCGLCYPLLMTLLGQLLFPRQANGSLLHADGRAVGAAFVGQEFTDLRFLHGRPSAVDYNCSTEEEKAAGGYAGPASGSQNLAPSNPALAERVEKDAEAFLRDHPGLTAADLPADLVTASGSGLDPHLSPAAARVQLPRLAQATGLAEEALEAMVEENTTGRFLGIFGEEAVNVLGVNLQIAQALGLVNTVE